VIEIIPYNSYSSVRALYPTRAGAISMGGNIKKGMIELPQNFCEINMASRSPRMNEAETLIETNINVFLMAVIISIENSLW
jgi:hypothetical protein